MKIAGIVLSGGQSKRMGRDKSLLKINNKTMLEHSMQILSESGIQNIYVSGKSGILDQFHNIGPIGGILTCLIQLKEYSHVLFIPVDMPLLTSKIIKQLLATSADKQCLSHFEKYNLPLIVKNTENTRKTLSHQIDKNSLSIREFIKNIETKTLKSNHEEICFTNTNSPQQFELARLFHRNAEF